jgi:hypothetical protein
MAAAIWLPFFILVMGSDNPSELVLLLSAMAAIAIIQGLRYQSPTLLWAAVGLLISIGFASIFSVGIFVLASSLMLVAIANQSAERWKVPTITYRGWLTLGLGIATISLWFV